MHAKVHKNWGEQCPELKILARETLASISNLGLDPVAIRQFREEIF